MNKNIFSIKKKYTVLGFKGNNLILRRKLLDMGITKGITFEIVKVSPFGDRFIISLRGYKLCINKKDLNFINLSLKE